MDGLRGFSDCKIFFHFTHPIDLCVTQRLIIHSSTGKPENQERRWRLRRKAARSRPGAVLEEKNPVTEGGHNRSHAAGNQINAHRHWACKIQGGITMKKIISLALCLALACFALTGCSGEAEPFAQEEYTADPSQIQGIAIDVEDRQIDVSLAED